MARRGVMTALQAALAGIGGAAGGYVQQQELERKRQEAERERKRQEQRDLITFGREAITPGPLATRAPAGLPTPEMPTGAPPSAIPMPTGRVDFGGAMRQLEQEEAVPSGTEAVEIGGRTLYIPVGQRYRDIKRSEELMADKAAVERAKDVARAQGEVQFQLDAAKNFGYYKLYSKQYGKKEAYDPQTLYKELIDLEEGARGRASAERAAAARSSVFGQQNIDAGVDFTSDVEAVTPYLTGEEVKGGKRQTVAPSIPLDNYKLMAVIAADRGEALPQMATMALRGITGADLSNEQTYYSAVKGIATAYAIREQRGRNVSDKDVANRVNQLLIQPQEVGNATLEVLKANRLKQWANALRAGSVPQLRQSDFDQAQQFNTGTLTPPVLGNIRRITEPGADTSVARRGVLPFDVTTYSFSR